MTILSENEQRYLLNLVNNFSSYIEMHTEDFNSIYMNDIGVDPETICNIREYDNKINDITNDEEKYQIAQKSLNETLCSYLNNKEREDN